MNNDDFIKGRPEDSQIKLWGTLAWVKPRRRTDVLSGPKSNKEATLRMIKAHIDTYNMKNPVRRVI